MEVERKKETNKQRSDRRNEREKNTIEKMEKVKPIIILSNGLNSNV